MVPRSKLDPDQNRFLDQLATGRQNKNYWIQGFVGSGKSVLIVYALTQAKQDNPDLDACVVLYTHSLIDMVKTGIPDDLGDVPVMTYYEFMKDARDYDLILVDEVQDLPENVLTQLERSANRLIVAGDSEQSIYSDRVNPDDIPRLADASPYTLSIIHRLTKKVIEVVQHILPSKQLEEAKRQRLQSVDVKLGKADSIEEETQYVWSKASQHASAGVPAAILLPGHDEIIQFANQVLRLEGQDLWQQRRNQYGKTNYESLNRHLRQASLGLQYLGSKYGSLKSAETSSQVFLMTYHSSKGLDFEAVFLPRLHESLEIWRDDDERAKTLFFVALTRSRRDLYLTYTGKPHRFVQKIPMHLVHQVEIPEPEVEESEEDDVIVF